MSFIDIYNEFLLQVCDLILFQEINNYEKFSSVSIIFVNNCSGALNSDRVAMASNFYDSGFLVYPNSLNSEVNVESLVP